MLVGTAPPTVTPSCRKWFHTPGRRSQELRVKAHGFIGIQNLGAIYKYTPGGSQTTFATGLNGVWGLAFDTSGNLFEGDSLSGHIYKFTPGGSRSTFASGLSTPKGLAFDKSGNLFEADEGSGNIYEYSTAGREPLLRAD